MTIVLHMGRQGHASGAETVPSLPNRSAQRIGEVDWSQLDDFSLEELFLLQVPMLRTCPHFLRNRLRECFGLALRERFRAKVVADEEAEVRAWKLFGLIPMMLLHKPKGVGSVGRNELAQRINLFQRGSWAQLIHQACSVPRVRSSQQASIEEEEQAHRGKAAQTRVQKGQVSRARQELIGASLAPRNAATLEELRRRRPQARQAVIPEEVTNFVPDDLLELDSKLFAACLRSAPSGSASGPGGCTNEILRVCLDDKETLLLLIAAAQEFARATVPDTIFRSFMLAHMTGLRKKDGGVRGIATGTVFRRLVAKTLAKQFMKDVEQACSPFQFALSTRAGVDCVGHAVRVATDADHTATVLSVDGIGAFDHVFRASMLQKLLEVPRLRRLLPFVRKSYNAPSCYSWADSEGRVHQIWQHEGGEQGDPLMPLLFSLAIHNALEEVRGQMQEGELLFAFLDDIYIVSSPVRTRAIYDLLQDHLHRMAGIQLHEGKTRVWNRAGVCPPNVADLGDEVWSPRGVKILGTPVGSPEFIHALTMERLEEERQLWKAIDWVPDLQCAWQILVQCAGPRCHHYVRTVPPSESRAYAEGHDTGMLETMRVF